MTEGVKRRAGEALKQTDPVSHGTRASRHVETPSPAGERDETVETHGEESVRRFVRVRGLVLLEKRRRKLAV